MGEAFERLKIGDVQKTKDLVDESVTDLIQTKLSWEDQYHNYLRRHYILQMITNPSAFRDVTTATAVMTGLGIGILLGTLISIYVTKKLIKPKGTTEVDIGITPQNNEFKDGESEGPNGLHNPTALPLLRHRFVLKFISSAMKDAQLIFQGAFPHAWFCYERNHQVEAIKQAQRLRSRNPYYLHLAELRDDQPFTPSHPDYLIAQNVRLFDDWPSPTMGSPALVMSPLWKLATEAEDLTDVGWLREIMTDATSTTARHIASKLSFLDGIKPTTGVDPLAYDDAAEVIRSVLHKHCIKTPAVATASSADPSKVPVDYRLRYNPESAPGLKFEAMQRVEVPWTDRRLSHFMQTFFSSKIAPLLEANDFSYGDVIRSKMAASVMYSYFSEGFLRKVCETDEEACQASNFLSLHHFQDAALIAGLYINAGLVLKPDCTFDPSLGQNPALTAKAVEGCPLMIEGELNYQTNRELYSAILALRLMDLNMEHIDDWIASAMRTFVTIAIVSGTLRPEPDAKRAANRDESRFGLEGDVTTGQQVPLADLDLFLRILDKTIGGKSMSGKIRLENGQMVSGALLQDGKSPGTLNTFFSVDVAKCLSDIYHDKDKRDSKFYKGQRPVKDTRNLQEKKVFCFEVRSKIDKLVEEYLADL